MAGVWLVNYDKSEVKSKRAHAYVEVEQKGVGDEEKLGKQMWHKSTHIIPTETKA